MQRVKTAYRKKINTAKVYVSLNDVPDKVTEVIANTAVQEKTIESIESGEGISTPTLGYYREIKKPKDIREGFFNFIQIIINCGDRGDAREATLQAVDLLEDLQCGAYDRALGNIPQAELDALRTELAQIETQIEARVQAAYQKGYAAGQADKAKQIREALQM